MKQVVQSYRTGELQIAEVPAPALRVGCVLVQSRFSCISAGTERAMIDLAKKSLLGKALARPDLARQVIGKARTEGPMEAYRQATNRLDSPVPLGYSASGVVLDVDRSVAGFRAGDRVAYAGHSFASHAEIACIPANLCVTVPDRVDLVDASFIAVGAIALHAIRIAHASLGDRVVVIGLGLIGQIGIQILHAAGCHALGIDIDPKKATLAIEYGADAAAVSGREDVLRSVLEFTGGAGADAVIIFAATPSNEPLELAASLARERGRVVAAGLVGLDVPRQPFYEKELEFTVSRAWGPGLSDPAYTQRGLDYPLPLARWTAGRNLAEFLELLSRSQVKVGHLISHRVPIERALEAYDLITGGKEPVIGVLLEYPQSSAPSARRISLPASRAPSKRGTIGVGLIGAGLFATTTLRPALRKQTGLRLRGLATNSGVSGQHAGAKHGFEYVTTEPEDVLGDPDVDCILIATRHGSHAHYVTRALLAGKHVFVEKPLALSAADLGQVEEAFRSEAASGRVLTVGFNR